MSWIFSFLIAVIIAVLAATGAGFIANACVDWYHMSSFEGASGYFVVAQTLLGAFCGFVGGFILSRFGSTFFSGLLISAGVFILLLATIALGAWGLADIPPMLNGHELDMVVEIRLPSGAARPPVLEGKQFLQFSSGGKGTIQRAQETGLLKVAEARFVA